ncbi:MAG TPA: hypothetical protein VI193_12530 [Acidimicrobiia bacterium]
MRHVELLGLPGSGKSTLAKELVRNFEGAIDLETAVHTAIREHGSDDTSRRVARISGSSGRLWKAAYARSTDRFDALARFVSGNSRLVEVVLSAQRDRSDRDRGQELVLGWVLNLMARFQLASESVTNELVVIDEGFCQRGVALFGYGFGPDDQGRLDEYLEWIPMPRTLVLVETPVDVCVERLNNRGWSERIVGLTPDVRRGFLDTSALVITAVSQRAESQGVAVIRVDGTEMANAAAEAVTGRLRV